MDPALLPPLVEAGGELVSLIAKLAQPVDPVQVLADMRVELAKLQAAIGPGGTLEQQIAAHNAALDAAIAAEKAKQADETTKP